MKTSEKELNQLLTSVLMSGRIAPPRDTPLYRLFDVPGKAPGYYTAGNVDRLLAALSQPDNGIHVSSLWQKEAEQVDAGSLINLRDFICACCEKKNRLAMYEKVIVQVILSGMTVKKGQPALIADALHSINKQLEKPTTLRK